MYLDQVIFICGKYNCVFTRGNWTFETVLPIPVSWASFLILWGNRNLKMLVLSLSRQARPIKIALNHFWYLVKLGRTDKFCNKRNFVLPPSFPPKPRNLELVHQCWEVWSTCIGAYFWSSSLHILSHFIIITISRCRHCGWCLSWVKWNLRQVYLLQITGFVGVDTDF